ncbi:HPP family protein [Xenorhabdus innexi]|uniref:Membrane protein n=1 Tax=Xenorhabdus innexi TaxID=290109 RepID=A0A1N6MV20_9GAMM|nr:HPP family protein [Xenorhabdus innexi]PHM35802.1 membrane protein [Xenorhabdus innexi]SIP72589.1 conserved hypothetical protein [Xenorhabdus innexi]
MSKLKGGGKLPSKPSLSELMKGLAGGFLGILMLGYLSQATEFRWLMAPFGATCVILFVAPASPLSQPRNIIGGHFLTTLVGLIALYTLGNSMMVMALAVGAAIMLMQWFRMVHPPAGANPLLVLLAGQGAVGFDFLFTPVLSGSILLVVISCLINNIGRENSWPIYWYGFSRKKEE